MSEIQVQVPSKMQPNIIGASYGQYYIGPRIAEDEQPHWFNADKVEIPLNISDMAIEQGETAFRSWEREEKVLKEEATHAAVAEAKQLKEAEKEAERRAAAQKQKEIDAGVDKALREMGIDPATKGHRKAVHEVVDGKNPQSSSVSSTSSKSSAPITNKEQKLSDLIAKCKTESELNATVKNVPHQIIAKLVAKLGKTPETGEGAKAKNIAIVAQELNLT